MLEEADAFVVEERSVLDRIGPGAKRDCDAIGTVGVNRYLFAVKVRRFHNGLCFIVEHLLAQPGADTAVDAASGSNLDDVGASADLPPYRLAAFVGPVADIGVPHVLVQVFTDAKSMVHVAGGRRDRLGRIDDARPVHPAARDRIAQRHRSARIAEIAYRGETSS